MKIVLYQPQIPQNTGNVVRTCSVTGNDLILVKPLGFSTQDRWLKRAGLDYWEGVDLQLIDEEEFEQLLNHSNRFYFFSSKTTTYYTDVNYTSNDMLIFGSETSGLPNQFQEKWPDRFLTIPQLPEKRCLNLATSVGIVVFEAWKQQKFVK